MTLCPGCFSAGNSDFPGRSGSQQDMNKIESEGGKLPVASRIALCSRWVKALQNANLKMAFVLPEEERLTHGAKGRQSAVELGPISLIFHLTNLEGVYAIAEKHPRVSIEVTFSGGRITDVDTFAKFVGDVISKRIKKIVMLTGDDMSMLNGNSAVLCCNDCDSAWNIAEHLLEQRGY